MKINTLIFATILSAGLSAGLGMSGCSQNEPQTNTAQKEPTGLPEAHAVLLGIIQTGDKAKLENDAQALASAALALSQIGAKPLGDDTPDLAKQWQAAARAIEPSLQKTGEDIAFRGRVKGPAYRKKVLAAGATEVLQEIYYASEKAELSLQSISGQTVSGLAVSGESLELNIVEQAENVTGKVETVCSLKLSAEPATCQWLPLWTAKYNITITNHGNSPVPYLLVTN